MEIKDKKIGDGNCYIIAEVGINHNGDLNLAKKLIDVAYNAGCDAVKFQKRTVDVVYTPEELAKPRDSPFGKTNGELKWGLEFSAEEYSWIDKYCKQKGITWFASPWDVDSVKFLKDFNIPVYKVASACLTYDDMLAEIKRTGKPIILSTGMSDMKQIAHAMDLVGDKDVSLLQCTALYPPAPENLNLNFMNTLKNMFKVPVGYSGHELGIMPSIAAAYLGADIIERHITLDRTMWGSDQKASIEPGELEEMVREIRLVPIIKGSGMKVVYEGEEPVMKKLRRYNGLQPEVSGLPK